MQHDVRGVDGLHARAHGCAEPRFPILCDHSPRWRWHVDHCGTQHHDDVIASSFGQRGHAGAQPAAVVSKHLRHAVSGPSSCGQQHAGGGGTVRHANSVTTTNGCAQPTARTVWRLSWSN